jgi:hypothetical protein
MMVEPLKLIFARQSWLGIREYYDLDRIPKRFKG